MDDLRKFDPGRVSQPQMFTRLQPRYGGVQEMPKMPPAPPQLGLAGQGSAVLLQPREVMVDPLALTFPLSNGQDSTASRQAREVHVETVASPAVGSSMQPPQLREKRKLSLDELSSAVLALQKQVEALTATSQQTSNSEVCDSEAFESFRSSVEAVFQQQNQALAKTEARVVRLEQEVNSSKDMEALLNQQAQLISSLQGELVSANQELSAQQQSVKVEIRRFEQELIVQSASQQSLTSKVESWDSEVRQLLDMLEGSPKTNAAVSSDAVEQISSLEKDIIGLRASSEAHEDLIMNMDSTMKQLHQVYISCKRDQDVHVRNFSSISKNMSKELSSLSHDVKRSKSLHNSLMAVLSTPSALPVQVDKASGEIRVARPVETINNKICPASS